MRFIKLLLILSLMVSFVGCSSSTNNETNENKEKIETKSKKVNKYKIIDEFISNYEKKYNTSIADVQKMNIQGEDYRVEFRLNAFKNAIGKKGTLNGYKIEIVNYGVWSRDLLRIYLTADTNDNAQIMLKQLLKVVDKNISDDNINELTGTSSNSLINSSINDCEVLVDIEAKNINY